MGKLFEDEIKKHMACDGPDGMMEYSKGTIRFIYKNEEKVRKQIWQR